MSAAYRLYLFVFFAKEIPGGFRNGSPGSPPYQSLAGDFNRIHFIGFDTMQSVIFILAIGNELGIYSADKKSGCCQFTG